MKTNTAPFISVDETGTVNKLLDQAKSGFEGLNQFAGNNSINKEIDCLRGLACLFQGAWYVQSESQYLPDDALESIATLTAHLVDNLEAGLERAIIQNIADLEALASAPEED